MTIPHLKAFINPVGVVDAYFNFRKRCFSIRQRGKVIAHTDCIELVDAAFVVSEAGRQRVLREQRKNVHAVIRGTVEETGADFGRRGLRVRYDPYLMRHFMTEDGDNVVTAGAVKACIKHGNPVVRAMQVKMI